MKKEEYIIQLLKFKKMLNRKVLALLILGVNQFNEDKRTAIIHKLAIAEKAIWDLKQYKEYQVELKKEQIKHLDNLSAEILQVFKEIIKEDEKNEKENTNKKLEFLLNNI